jgi:quercetin dioxygenase-like cupin family protein
LPTGDKRLWRIRITRRTAADLPRVLTDTAALPHTDDEEGAVWRLETRLRQLDANVIRLRPAGQIQSHVGPDLDVLLHVVDGSGQIITAADPVEVQAGAVVWLPRRSERAIIAGPYGLTYLSIHTRRPGLSIGTADDQSAAITGCG